MDREKIINAIEKAKKQSEEYAQDRIIVPFKEADMILALLKEQEAVVHCKDCINRHDSINCQMYSEGMDTPDDWYCADGECKEVK